MKAMKNISQDSCWWKPWKSSWWWKPWKTGVRTAVDENCEKHQNSCWWIHEKHQSW